jgi:hypothetical protein
MIKMLGLSVVAILAFAAFAAASASASQPHFETESGEFNIPFSGSGGAGKLETVGGRIVTCTGNSNSGGTINSATTTAGSTVKFTGCTAFGLPCTSSGQSSGTIVTLTTVNGTLVYSEHASGQVASVLLKPASGTTFAEFNCGSPPFFGSHLTVRGSVLGTITPVNGAFSKTSTLSFTQTGGVQESGTVYRAPSGCAKTTATLESKGEGVPSFGFEQSAIEGSTTLTASEGVKVVSSPPCV